MKRFDRFFGLFVVGMLALAVLACAIPGLGGQGTPPTETPQASKPSSGGALPTKVPALEQPTEASSTASSSSSFSAGVDKLDSYEITYTLSVAGKDDSGKDVNESMNMTNQVIKSQNASRFSLVSTGTGSDGTLEMVQVGGQTYMVTPGQNGAADNCISVSGSDSTSKDLSIFSPQDLVGTIEGGTFVGDEVVNGIPSKHYTVKNALLGFGQDITSEKGDVWVSADRTYVTKFTGEAVGKVNIFNTVDGTSTWTYELKNPNAVKTIDVPETCKAQAEAMKDLPVPATATDVSTLGALITFSLPDEPKAANDLITKEAEAKGWKVGNPSDLGGAMFTFEITKGDLKFSITVTAGTDNKGSTVLMTKSS